jgi:pimeloyl-ACP methyl ester carboxylesterase
MNLVSRIAALLSAAALSGCVQATIAWTDLDPKGEPAATPPALGPFEGAPAIATPADWHDKRLPALREALQNSVYGMMPEVSTSSILDRRVLKTDAFGGKGVLEEYRLAASASFGGVAVPTRDSATGGGFVMNVVKPAKAPGKSPVILMETFCPRWRTIPDPAVAQPAGAGGPGGGGVETYVFGRFICTPPIETILDAGYAVATIHPSEIVPDRSEEGLAELKRLSAGHADDETRWGAIAAWAWLYSRMIDALEQDEALDPEKMIAYGHSRYGKSALVAAAYDERIDGAIAHQSGAGGASLNRRKKGESVSSMMRNYPHWFARSYAAYAEDDQKPSVDQHLLLAMAAPRPILLGNARRDVWSDPNGAFRAAMGADPVYELMGAEGLRQEKLRPYDPSAELSFWIRPGTHGVTEEDWPAFLQFLDAHFKEKGGRR